MNKAMTVFAPAAALLMATVVVGDGRNDDNDHSGR